MAEYAVIAFLFFMLGLGVRKVIDELTLFGRSHKS